MATLITKIAFYPPHQRRTNVTPMTLPRLFLTAFMCCVLGVSNVSAASIDDAHAAYKRSDYAQAITLYSSLAEQGNVDAQHSLGVMYYNGQGVPHDAKESFKWYMLAAEQGNVKSQAAISSMYFIGQGVTQNYQEAMKWWRLSVEQGFEVSIAYLKHLASISKPHSSSLEGFTQSAVDDAKSSYENGDYRQALKILTPLAEKGIATAQYDIAGMYENGEGVTQNYQEALKWYRLAAEQGNTKAIAHLKILEAILATQNTAPQESRSKQPHQLVGFKTDTKQAEQIRTKTYAQSLEQLRQSSRSVTDSASSQERVSPPRLILKSSTPNPDGSVELSGRVISDARISKILINGEPLKVPLTKDGSFKVNQRLTTDTRVYRLSVVNEFGQKTNAEITVEHAVTQYIKKVVPLNPRKLKSKANPNAVALIIGIEAYSRLPQAQYAASDANHFYDYASQSMGIPLHKIKLLTDTKANRIDLLLAMRNWMKTEIINGKSDVYIFFAGHGLASTDGSKIHLLASDSHLDLLDETSILRDDLIASANGAKTITIFLDTCYSGGTRTNETLLTDARPIAILPDMNALPSNVTVLSAASGSQLSSAYEAAQQGLFSYWLMKGLEGDADANQDKKITTGELNNYVAKQVIPMAQRRNRQQEPELRGDSTRVLVSY